MITSCNSIKKSKQEKDSKRNVDGRITVKMGEKKDFLEGQENRTQSQSEQMRKTEQLSG